MSEVPGPRKTEHPGPSQIPRAMAGSSVSLPSKASPSRSLSSDSERGPRSERGPIPRLQSSFTGRLGQPPRGPLSLHMYSRKNVFLQHSIHTAELQALAQQDGWKHTHIHARIVTHASDGYELLVQFLSDREYLQTHMHSVTFKAIFPLKPQMNLNRTPRRLYFVELNSSSILSVKTNPLSALLEPSEEIVYCMLLQ